MPGRLQAQWQPCSTRSPTSAPSSRRGLLGPLQRLVARKREQDRPQLRPALGAGKGQAQGPQVAADGLELPQDRLRALRIELTVRALTELAEPLEGLRGGRGGRLGRSQNRIRDLAGFDEIARAAHGRDELERSAYPLGQLLVAQGSDRVDRQPAQSNEVVVDV